jgi:hypothetical protein
MSEQRSELSPKPSAQGNKCTTCGYVNRVGLLVCENCGTNLITSEHSILGTKKFQKNAESTAEGGNSTAIVKNPILDSNEMRAVDSAGTHVFKDNMLLRLEIDGATTPILIYPKAETALGRRDPATGTMPDVDLTSYAAYRMGVSRKHSIITLKSQALAIIDLGSSNGTSVNGVKLAPHQPHPLRDGDEITLGKMNMRAIFQQSTTKR